MSDALAGFGSIVGMFGSLEEGEATANSLDSQAKMQRQNAQLAEQKGQADALRLSVLADRQMSSIRSGYASSGIASNSGTVRAVLQSSGQAAELDRLNVLHGADIRALNYKNQASLDEFGANQALTGSYFTTIGQAFSGAAKQDARSRGGATGGGYTGGDDDLFGGQASNGGAGGYGSGPSWFYGDNPSPHAQPELA